MKAIIIGASSGMGKELAKILAKEKYELGLAARRTELLKELKSELDTKSFVKYIDVSKTDEAMNNLSELIKEMKDVDLIIITSGTGYINYELDWSKEKETIDINVSGVTSMINIAFKYFMKKQSGHLVVLSSIAALKGNNDSPAYSASKAFLANYLEGLRLKIKKDKLNITITDIRPGLVDTDMAKGEGLFWVQLVDKTAKQIYISIKKEKSCLCYKKMETYCIFNEMVLKIEFDGSISIFLNLNHNTLIAESITS